MGGRLLPVGSFRGVPLYFAPSWVLIAVLITVTYNRIIYDNVAGIGRGASYAVAFVFAVLLALSVLAHELGHTAVSLALGQPGRCRRGFAMRGRVPAAGVPAGLAACGDLSLDTAP